VRGLPAGVGEALAGLWRLWRDRGGPNEKGFRRDLLWFLPADLELQETPPHPAPGLLMWIFLAMLLFAAVWSVFGRLDIICVAEGSVIPDGKVRVVQPYDRGVVGAVLVREGQRVEPGQALIELDPTQAEADGARLESERRLAERTRLRRLALSELLRLPGRQPAGLVLARPEVGGDPSNGLALLEEYSAVASRLEHLASQRLEREAELRANEADIRRLEDSIPLNDERLAVVQRLHDRRLIGMNEYLTVRERQVELARGLEAARQRSVQLREAVRSAESQIESYRAESLASALAELDGLEQRLEAVGQELAKARELASRTTLRSPVRGAVKGLRANTVGGVVSPAEVLMEIVPAGEALEVEAFVGNADIGYVEEGQPAEVKVATFPFTRYGTIGATVIHVAGDATADDRAGLVYRVRLRLDRDRVTVDGRDVPLLPGMAVTAEIATGKRRVIEYLLSPLLRMKHDSFRER
jgi:hemolysin D